MWCSGGGERESDGQDDWKLGIRDWYQDQWWGHGKWERWRGTRQDARADKSDTDNSGNESASLKRDVRDRGEDQRRWAQKGVTQKDRTERKRVGVPIDLGGSSPESFEKALEKWEMEAMAGASQRESEIDNNEDEERRAEQIREEEEERQEWE